MEMRTRGPRDRSDAQYGQMASEILDTLEKEAGFWVWAHITRHFRGAISQPQLVVRIGPANREHLWSGLAFLLGFSIS